MRRFWEGLLRNSWWVVAIFFVMTVFMVVGAKRIVQDTSAEQMDPDHNAIVELNKSINAEFNVGRSEIFVLHADQVFTPTHLVEIREITARLEAIKGVKKVDSLSNAPKMTESDGTFMTGDMVGEGTPSEADIAEIRRCIETNYMLKSGLIAAKDGSSTNIMVQFEDSEGLSSIANALEAPVRALWTGSYDLTGIPSLEKFLLSTVRRDMPILGGIALLIILVMFAINFRSQLGVWMPLLQIVLGLIWGAGLFGWIGWKFMAITVIAPIAILAVGSSFTLHLLGRYFLELLRGTPKDQAIVNTLMHTGLGVFVSGLAISASLLTFLLSDLAMVRGLGLFAALGVFSCMVSSLVFLPALLHLLPKPTIRVKMEKAGALGALLDRLGHWTGRHPKAILGTGALFIALAAFGIFRIVPNTSLIAFFRADSSVIVGMDAVNRVFGGSTTATALVEGDLQDPALLKGILNFQEEAKSIPGLGSSTSLASLIRSLHETLTGEAGMPSSRELVAQELLVYQASESVDDITSLANLDYSRGIVTFITPRLSTHETTLLFQRIGELATKHIGAKAKVSFAGDVLSETAMQGVLIHDFIISITLALILVILIDSLIRSIRAALVTIIVLVSTIILQYGILGLTGVPFNAATAIMGALAIGVGDYAIHLTVRYMEDRRHGLSPEEAIASALATSGRSIFFTVLTIGGGFTALCFSQLVPVATLGGMMVMTVVIVGVATLTLLPAACVLFLRNPLSHMEVKENA